jgi:hypothetical protein
MSIYGQLDAYFLLLDGYGSDEKWDKYDEILQRAETQIQGIQLDEEYSHRIVEFRRQRELYVAYAEFAEKIEKRAPLEEITDTYCRIVTLAPDFKDTLERFLAHVKGKNIDQYEQQLEAFLTIQSSAWNKGIGDLGLAGEIEAKLTVTSIQELWRYLAQGQTQFTSRFGLFIDEVQQIVLALALRGYWKFLEVMQPGVHEQYEDLIDNAHLKVQRLYDVEQDAELMRRRLDDLVNNLSRLKQLATSLPNKIRDRDPQIKRIIEIVESIELE